MSLVDELSRELNARAGLRVQTEWRAAIGSVLARCQPGVGVRPEQRERLLFEVARHVTVPESHFFRNGAQLERCLDHTDEVRRKEQRRCQLWCAGSASGEEPYSLAMSLYRRFGSDFAEHFDLVGSDMNPEVVERARQATYTAWSFRGAPEWCFAHFANVGNGRLRLRTDVVRRSVEFRVETCQEGVQRWPNQGLDALFFRNVAIYLEPEATSALYHEFARVLRPGGLLALGPSDPWPNDEHFRYTGNFDHAPVFERVEPSRTSSRSPSTPAEPAVCPVESDPAQLRLPFEFDDADRGPVLVEARTSQPTHEESAPAGTEQPLDVEALRVMGHVYLQQNDAPRAVAALRQAVFLESSDELSRYFYALALHESGDARQALRQLRNIVEALRSGAPERVLGDGTTLAGELLKSALTLEAEWK